MKEATAFNYEKLRSWIDSYVDYLEKNIEIHKSNAKEGYKFKEVHEFKKNFDISSVSKFKSKLADAITYSNLTMGGNWYARESLLGYLKIDADFVYKEIIKLLDEKRSVALRIDEFRDSFNKKRIELIKKKVFTEKYKSTYMDFRFLSYILACHNPEKYVHGKQRDFDKFLEKTEAGKISPKNYGERYEIYLKYTNIAREELKKNREYLKLHKKLVEGSGYSDKSLSWGTQDFIYTINNYSLTGPLSEGDNKLSELITHKSQVIFYGPPGTGKTYNARKFAVHFIKGGT